MSGVKDTPVTLMRSQYDRIMNACRRADDIDNNIQRNLSAATGRLQNEFNGQIKRINQRHSQFENALAGMSSDMRQMESRFNQGLRDLSGRFQQGLSELDNRLSGQIQRQDRETNRRLQGQRREYTRMFSAVSADLQDLRGDLSRFENETTRRFADQRREYLTLMQEQSEQFANALAEQRQHLESQIQDINQRLAAEKQNKQERAQAWASDTEQLLNAIDESYRHDKFQPGELNKLRSELVLMHSNLSNGDYEAAIGACQQTYLRAKTLQMVLEQLEHEWLMHLNSAKLSAAEVVAACDAQQLAEFVLEEGTEPVKAEVDYWTEGKLSALRARAEAAQQTLETPDALSLADLQRSVVDSGQMRELVELLSEQAKEALIASQLRNNIGQAIEEALYKAGWEVADAVYEGEDQRRALHLKLKNMAGDELVTIVTPEQTGETTIQNRLNISFFDHSTNDEARRRESVRHITQILHEEQLECSSPQCVPGTENRPCEDTAKLDFEAVRQKRPATEQPR